jgi:hypothetical protein
VGGEGVVVVVVWWLLVTGWSLANTLRSVCLCVYVCLCVWCIVWQEHVMDKYQAYLIALVAVFLISMNGTLLWEYAMKLE